MRNSLRCPKCAHEKILHLPRLWAHSQPLGEIVAHVGGGWSPTPFGVMQAYVCARCGFTELYAQQPDKIPIDKIDGAQVLDGAQGAPYR